MASSVLPPVDVRVVFFDIDGTLVSFRTHTIPESTLRAVRYLRRRGIQVWIATGRPFLLIDNLGELEYDGLITTTGADVRLANGNSLLLQPIMEDDVMRVVDYQKLNPDTAYPLFVVTTHGVVASRITHQVSAVCKLLAIEEPPLVDWSELDTSKVLQLISFFQVAQEAEYMSALMPHCTAMRWHPDFADIIAGGVSKCSGIDAVLRHLGLTPQQAVAFGDGGNDIDMLAHVGWGVAMGNAEERVKASAHYVTSPVDEDGVLRALQHLRLMP